MTTCDLRTAPLFPVIDPERGPIIVGLRDLLLHAHRYVDLAVSVPPVEVGMLRVLYTIAARITGLDTIEPGDGSLSAADEWAARRREVVQRGRFDEDAIDAYLTAHAGRWDLFDPQSPWMQDPRLAAETDLKSVNVLDPTRPGDNSPIWWRHTHAGHAPAIPVDEAFGWLVVHHFYGSGGTGGTRRVGTVASQHMSAGPLRAALHFSPLADTLFTTLLAGIPSPASVPDHSGRDIAPWEHTERHDPLAVPPDTTWPAGLLVGRSRHALLLVPDDAGETVTGCYLTWAWKPRHPPCDDPYTILDHRNDGTWQPREASRTRAVWRDVDALLADRADHHRPAILTAALSLPDQIQDSLRVRVHGFDQDRQATNVGWFTGSTPPLIAYMSEHDPVRATGAADLHAAAEDTAAVLRSALRTAYRSLGTGEPPKKPIMADVPWIEPAETHYWPAAGTQFWQRIRAADFAEPYHAMLPIALAALAAATRHLEHEPAVTREVTKAARYLRNFAHKKNPRTPKAAPTDQETLDAQQ